MSLNLLKGNKVIASMACWYKGFLNPKADALCEWAYYKIPLLKFKFRFGNSAMKVAINIGVVN